MNWGKNSQDRNWKTLPVRLNGSIEKETEIHLCNKPLLEKQDIKWKMNLTSISTNSKEAYHCKGWI